MTEKIQSGHREPSLGQTYRRNETIATRTIGDEFILVPVKGELARLQQVFVLNAVGAFIWDRLDGAENLEELRNELGTVFDVDPDRAERDLLEYIDLLAGQGLVAEIGPR